jgi:hypothetical protein
MFGSLCEGASGKNEEELETIAVYPVFEIVVPT